MGAYEAFSDPYEYQYSPYEFYDEPDNYTHYYNTTFNYYYYSYDPYGKENTSEVIDGNDTYTYNYNYHYYYDSPYSTPGAGDEDPSFLGEDE
jgi:hypothetical protein